MPVAGRMYCSNRDLANCGITNLDESRNANNQSLVNRAVNVSALAGISILDKFSDVPNEISILK